MSDLNEIRQLLDDTAKDLAQALPEPGEWSGWIVYLLEVLEVAAMDIDPDHPEAFEMSISGIAAEIGGRLQEGRW